MADDSLVLGLKYKIIDGPVKVLEGKIASTIERSKMLEKQSNKTSKALNKMIDGYRKRQEKANNSGGKMVETLKRMAGAALTMAGIMKGIDMASDFQETSDKLGDVYGKTTDTVLQSVDAMNKRLRVSRVELTGYYADTGAIMKGLGLSTEKAFTKSNKAIQASIDLASFHNLTTERAMNAVRSAMLGESEALKSATGIIVLESMMEEYAKTMGKTWKELNNTEKAMLRLDYILQQSELQNATDNAYKTRNSFANLRKQLGGLAKDIATKTFTALTRELTPALQGSYKALKSNEGIIVGLGEGIGKTISSVTNFVGWINKGSAGAITAKTALGALTGAYVAYKIAAGLAFAITKAQDMWRKAVTIPGIFKENLGLIKTTAISIYKKSVQLPGFILQKAQDMWRFTKTIPGLIREHIFLSKFVIAYGLQRAAKLKDYVTQKAMDSWRFMKSIPGMLIQGSIIAKNIALWVLDRGAKLAAFAATKTMTAAQWALNVALNANPIGLAIAGITALAAGFTLAYKKIEPFREAVDKVWERLKNSMVGKAIMKVLNIDETEKTATTKTVTASVPAFAKGTNSAPGGTALVGEKGPELVNLPRGSQVIPAKQTSSMISEGKSIIVQGDSITIHLGAIQENFEEAWSKLERKLDERERRKSQRIKALIGGV